MKTLNRELLRKDMSVLRNFEDPDRGHVFLFMAPTIEDQLKNCDKLLNELSDKLLSIMNTDEDMLSLLNEHRNQAMESAESFEKDNLQMAVKSKAPSPCPGGCLIMFAQCLVS